MKVLGIVINPNKDTVAVVTNDVKKGDTVAIKKDNESRELTALCDIPIYHKICLRNMSKGEVVIKYGEGIGRLTEDVPAGGYIHTHNLGRMNS